MTIHLPTVFLPICALIAVGALAGAFAQRGRVRALEAEVAALAAATDAAHGRQRELETTVARQHQALQAARGELDTLRFQIDGAELQLDGIDYLSTLLRRELDLPPGSGTWSGGAGAETPQGGRYGSAGSDSARLALIQRRLAAGLAELYLLQDFARARSRPAATRATVPPVDAPPANWPARGAVTSSFGWRVFRGRPNYHTGIDIALPYGSQVLATGHGTVVGAGWQPGFGWCVLIQHPGGYSTLYAHLAEATVTVGDGVAPGDLIAFSGSSGMSTGPHLHYEIWKDGQLVDPRPSMDGTGTR